MRKIRLSALAEADLDDIELLKGQGGNTEPGEDEGAVSTSSLRESR